MIDSIQKKLLKEIAGLDGLPVGAYNIRANGAAAGRNTTANIYNTPNPKCEPNRKKTTKTLSKSRSRG